jgi:transcriptional regulator with XRE-family HTH domain
MKKFHYIGSLVKTRRKNHEKKLTQEDVAKALGFGSHLISNIERERSSVSIRNIVPLCRVLGIDTDEMIEAMVKDYEHCLKNRVQKYMLTL